MRPPITNQDQTPTPPPRHGRKHTAVGVVAWLVGLGCLLLSAWVAWSYLRPVLQVRKICGIAKSHAYWRENRTDVLARLGTPQQVIAKVCLYLKMPGWVAPND